MKVIAYLLLIVVLLEAGCSPPTVNPVIPNKTEFEKTPSYTIKDKLDSMPKPTQLVLTYVKVYGNKVVKVDNPADADMVLFSFEEIRKVTALKELAISYKDIILNQEVLINNYIATINSLKELLAIKDAIIQQYATMYANSENAYLRERYEHGKDNLINKIFFYTTSLGAVVLALVLKTPVH